MGEKLETEVAKAIAHATFLQSDSGVYPKWSDFRNEAVAAIGAVRWQEGSVVDDLENDNAKLREQVQALTNAYAEAVAIIAKWSPGGLGQLRCFLEDVR